MPLKIKDKKILWTKLYFRQFYNEQIWITWGLFVDKGSGSGIFPDPDPGDQKRPDPTGSGSGSGSATLIQTILIPRYLENILVCIYLPLGQNTERMFITSFIDLSIIFVMSAVHCKITFRLGITTLVSMLGWTSRKCGDPGSSLTCSFPEYLV